MPQLTVYLSGASQAPIFSAADLGAMNRALASVETVKLEDIKSRLVVCETYCTGTGDADVKSLLVRCGVLLGRSMQVKEKMRDVLLDACVAVLGERTGYSVAVDVYEMPCYGKISL